MNPNRGLFLMASLIFSSCANEPQVPVIIQSALNDDELLARRAWNQALAKLHKADFALDHPSEMTQRKLKSYFGTDSPQVRQHVSQVIRRMIIKSSNYCYTIQIEEDAATRVTHSHYLFERSEGLVGHTSSGGPPLIILNRRFLRGNPNGMPSVLLHELSHNAAQTQDFGYYRGGIYKLGSEHVLLDESQRLENADTYSEFIDHF
jgi:hypothetical protein